MDKEIYFIWICPRCGAENTSEDRHCNCERYEYEEEE